jgi:hypothetical protein
VLVIIALGLVLAITVVPALAFIKTIVLPGIPARASVSITIAVLPKRLPLPPPHQEPDAVQVAPTPNKILTAFIVTAATA